MGTRSYTYGLIEMLFLVLVPIILSSKSNAAPQTLNDLRWHHSAQDNDKKVPLIYGKEKSTDRYYTCPPVDASNSEQNMYKIINYYILLSNYSNTPIPNFNISTPLFNFTSPQLNYTVPCHNYTILRVDAPTVFLNYSDLTADYSPNYNYTNSPHISTTETWNYTSPSSTYSSDFNHTSSPISVTTGSFNYTESSSTYSSTSNYSFTSLKPWNYTETTSDYSSSYTSPYNTSTEYLNNTKSPSNETSNSSPSFTAEYTTPNPWNYTHLHSVRTTAEFTNYTELPSNLYSVYNSTYTPYNTTTEFWNKTESSTTLISSTPSYVQTSETHPEIINEDVEKGHHLVIGTPGWGDRILFHQTIFVNNTGSGIIFQNVSFPRPGQFNKRVISSIHAWDLSNNYAGEYPRIVDGGLGSTGVTVEFNTKPSKTIFFSLILFGR